MYLNVEYDDEWCRMDHCQGNNSLRKKIHRYLMSYEFRMAYLPASINHVGLKN